MDIRERLRVETQGYSMYNVRRKEYKNEYLDDINFRVSPKPFQLTMTQKKQIEEIGQAVCAYMDCCIELYKDNEDVHELLDRGKPDALKNVKEIKYLFLRPDLIITDSGFCLCEIETSPFGLGLAEVLNRTYGNEGYNTIIHQNQLKNYIQSKVDNSGTIAYSDKVKSFSGQLEFMAKNIFSSEEKKWEARQINSEKIKDKQIYRAFYLNEQYIDKNVAELLNSSHTYLPTSTPQFEEKALLSFIWDKRYVKFLSKQLGSSNFELLRKIIPITWILGEERYIDGGLPRGKQDTFELVDIGKNNRKFVLKQSGFSVSSSWGEGVKFLHKMGKNKALEMLKVALEDKEHLYIIQEYKQGKNISMQYIDNDYTYRDINAKIRITPYYAYMAHDKGKLIAAKVTGCENTEYIHASTASINTAVSYDKHSIERD